MKKLLSFVLATVLLLGLAAPAFAAQSPAAEESVPSLLLSATSGKYRLVTTQNVYSLSKQDRETFKSGQKSLPDAVPAGTSSRYYFFLETSEQCDVVFNINGFTVPIVMQYVDDEWVELDYEINKDGTITVKDAVNAPIAFFFLNDGWNKTLLISTTTKKHKLVTTQSIGTLPQKDQNMFRNAFNALSKAVEKENAEGENLRVRYFFFLSASETCDALFGIDFAENPTIKQFVDGEWVELELVSGDDATTVAKQAENAPVVIAFPRQAAK